jgi:hypothetical protein
MIVQRDGADWIKTEDIAVRAASPLATGAPGGTPSR